MLKSFLFPQDGTITPSIQTELSDNETDDEILNIHITGSVYSRKDSTSKVCKEDESVVT